MTYSGNGVDDLVIPMLPAFGYACDVGASDGVFFSNTLALEEKGWLVLCVEPNPMLESSGRSRRKLWRQVAAHLRDEEVTFWADGEGPTWASYSRVDLGRGQPFKVQGLRLDRILEEAGFPRLDFLTVDTEGWEPPIMEGFTIERWKPSIIVTENWAGETPAPPGYRMVSRLEYDNVFVRDVI